MAFNRDRNFQRGGFKKDFNDRESRGPITMHQATCSKCGKECEVPFRPTSGKPVYCNDCFDRPRDSDSGRSEGRFDKRPSFNERRDFSEKREDFATVCDQCGKNCTVPFRPTAGKPIYCRECFGEKKNDGERNIENSNYKQQFDALNSKVDKILRILEAATAEESSQEEISEEPVVLNENAPEIVETVEKPLPKKRKTAKK